MNKTALSIIAIIVVVLIGGGIWYFMASSNQKAVSYNSPAPTTTTTQNTTDQTTAAQQAAQQAAQNGPKGNLYLSMTDAAANMANITAVTMTIDNVKVYNQVNGWLVTAQTPLNPVTFSLLDLKAKSESQLIGKLSVPVGTYQEFELHIAKVMVTTSSGQTTQAILPSNYFVVTDNVMVNANTNTAVNFDVMADKSLHVADNGQFVFAPVIQFNSRVNATVQVDANNMVTASFGQTSAAVNEGMDVDGTVKTNFMISPDANLNTSGKVITIDNAASL